jgi:hypothetical protein
MELCVEQTRYAVKFLTGILNNNVLNFRVIESHSPFVLQQSYASM